MKKIALVAALPFALTLAACGEKAAEEAPAADTAATETMEAPAAEATTDAMAPAADAMATDAAAAPADAMATEAAPAATETPAAE